MRAKLCGSVFWMTAVVLILPLVVSCAGVRDTSGAVVTKVRQFSFSDLRPAKMDVVEVREKDLKPLPTGEERALAYQRSGRRWFGFFGPVDYVEPDLPAAGGAVDGGLLPSLD